ncbi:MAG: hypothetical protein M1548_06385 [Actinobacteria bacterium]|nr:hypothetical protein [Actinomycetota bacterium]
MTESKLLQIIRELLEDLTQDIVEERVVAYIVKELQMGRSLGDVLKDPYVSNRFDEEKIGELLQNKEILFTVEKELGNALSRDFRFGDR